MIEGTNASGNASTSGSGNITSGSGNATDGNGTQAPQQVARTSFTLRDYRLVPELRYRTLRIAEIPVNTSKMTYFDFTHTGAIVPGSFYAYQVFSVGMGNQRSTASNLLVTRALGCPIADTLLSAGKVNDLSLIQSASMTNLNISFSVQWAALTPHDVGHDTIDGVTFQIVSNATGEWQKVSRAYTIADGNTTFVIVYDLSLDSAYDFKLQMSNSHCTVNIGHESSHRFATPPLPSLPAGVRRVRLTLDSGLRDPDNVSFFEKPSTEWPHKVCMTSRTVQTYASQFQDVYAYAPVAKPLVQRKLTVENPHGEKYKMPECGAHSQEGWPVIEVLGYVQVEVPAPVSITSNSSTLCGNSTLNGSTVELNSSACNTSTTTAAPTFVFDTNRARVRLGRFGFDTLGSANYVYGTANELALHWCQA